MSDNKWIDLRSDTVTQPTQQMRAVSYTHLTLPTIA